MGNGDGTRNVVFRRRRYDTAPGAAVSSIACGRQVDGPTDTVRIDVSTVLA